MIRIHLWSISSDSILGIGILDLLSRQETKKIEEMMTAPQSRKDLLKARVLRAA
jgi:hypothetical protein